MCRLAFQMSNVHFVHSVLHSVVRESFASTTVLRILIPSALVIRPRARWSSNSKFRLLVTRITRVSDIARRLAATRHANVRIKSATWSRRGRVNANRRFEIRLFGGGGGHREGGRARPAIDESSEFTRMNAEKIRVVSNNE